jgi:hypothetical protein
MLSDDARIFWVPGYTSPSPAQFLLLFGLPIIAAVPGLKGFWRNERGRLIFWFVPLSLAGYLFFDRLLVFLAVALLPVIAISLRRKWSAAAIAALLVLQSAFPRTLAGAITSSGLRFGDSSSLLNDTELDSFLAWLEHDTGKNEAVMSFWHISGLVSAYAERPVATHTFFENSDNREAIMRFAKSMFMPEDSLVAFMRERDCVYMVHQADFVLDTGYSGLLYLAGLSTIPDDAVALSMNYRPEELDSFSLVFQGPSLRVFSLDRSAKPDLQRSFLFEERYRDCYEGYDEARSILSDMRGWSGYLADTGIEMNDPDMLSGALLLGLAGGGPQDVTEMMLNDLVQWYIQGGYRLDSLADDIDSFTWYCGDRPELRLLLARLYASEGRLSEAREQYNEVLAQDPGNPYAGSELDLITQEMGILMEGAGE